MDNGNPYVSSIIKLYGDIDNVKKDVKTLNEILSRQGVDLLLDVCAESIGQAALKFKFTDSDKAMTKIAYVDHFENAINERL